MDRRGDWDGVIVGQERGLGWGYSWTGSRRGDWDRVIVEQVLLEMDWDGVIVGQERGLG